MKKFLIIAIILTAITVIYNRDNNKTELNRINHDMVQACTIDMQTDKSIICD